MISQLENQDRLKLLTPDEYLCEACPEESHQPGDATRKLASSGFTVIKQLISADLTQELRDAFYTTIIPSTSEFGRIYRYRGKETNKISDKQHLLNPLSNLQLESSKNNNKQENEFIQKIVNLITTGLHIPFIKDATGYEQIRLLTWNLFHVVEPFTPPHQDCIFFNSELGLLDLLGVWIALEDIPPGASPLYLQRNSHTELVRFAKQHYSITPEYTSMITEYLFNKREFIVAPHLQAGDCIIWDSRTVHGSLLRTNPNATRLSITAHFEPEKKIISRKLGNLGSAQQRSLAKRRLFDIHEIKKLKMPNNTILRSHRSRIGQFTKSTY